LANHEDEQIRINFHKEQDFKLETIFSKNPKTDQMILWKSVDIKYDIEWKIHLHDSDIGINKIVNSNYKGL